MKIGLKEKLWNGVIYKTALVRQNVGDSIKNLNPKNRKEERVSTCPSYPVTVKKQQITRYVAPTSADSAEVHYYAHATDNCKKKPDAADNGEPKGNPDDQKKTGQPMLGHDNGPDFSGFATE